MSLLKRVPAVCTERSVTGVLGEGAETASAAEPVTRSVGWLHTLFDADTFQPWRPPVDDGVVAGSAHIGGHRVCVWAQDVTYRGGTLGSAGGETIARTIRRANHAGIPVVGIPHSGGARLQEGVAALGAYGAIFREQALSRVPQITVIPGACAGGAAYSPALGDIVVMVGPHARLFLTGPKVTEWAIGERVSADDLGGSHVHGANGVAHLLAHDGRDAATLVRELLGYLRPGTRPRKEGPLCDDMATRDPIAHVPSSTRHGYDIRSVVSALVDGDLFLELATMWARNLVTIFATIAGRSVGVIANQPLYRGGAMDNAASEKGKWFVDLCDRFAIPLVVLVDTPGFLPGTKEERAGVIRHGAGLLRAFARATVPKITVTLRQAYGGAHIVMNSRNLGADLTLAWPGAQIGIMGAHQAVKITEHRAIESGSDVDELAELYASTHTAVSVAVANGFIDEVVLPHDTRKRLIRMLEMHA